MINNRFLRRPEVETTTGLSRSTIYLRMKQGRFPKTISLGGGLVGWKESDIQKWLDECIKESKQTS